MGLDRCEKLAPAARVGRPSFLLSTCPINYCYRGTGSSGGTEIRGTRTSAALSTHGNGATVGYSGATCTARAGAQACGSRSLW